MTTTSFEILYNPDLPGTEERSFMRKIDEIAVMQSRSYMKELPKKICIDCGSEIIEKVESHLFQCEKCLRHCE